MKQRKYNYFYSVNVYNIKKKKIKGYLNGVARCVYKLNYENFEEFKKDIEDEIYNTFDIDRKKYWIEFMSINYLGFNGVEVNE